MRPVPPMRPLERKPDLARVAWPSYLAQWKYDGWNVVVHHGRVWTRHGEDITHWACFRGQNLDAPEPICAELLSDLGREQIPGLERGRGNATLAAYDVQAGMELGARLELLAEVCPRGGIWRRAHTYLVPDRPEANRLFAEALKLGHEGLVLKRIGSPYISGDRPEWVRMKRPA